MRKLVWGKLSGPCAGCACTQTLSEILGRETVHSGVRRKFNFILEIVKSQHRLLAYTSVLLHR